MNKKQRKNPAKAMVMFGSYRTQPDATGQKQAKKPRRRRKITMKSKPTGRAMPQMDMELFARDRWKAINIYRAQLWSIAVFDLLELYTETRNGNYRPRQPQELGVRAKRVVSEIITLSNGRTDYECLSKDEALNRLVASFLEYGEPPQTDLNERIELLEDLVTSQWWKVD